MKHSIPRICFLAALSLQTPTLAQENLQERLQKHLKEQQKGYTVGGAHIHEHLSNKETTHQQKYEAVTAGDFVVFIDYAAINKLAFIYDGLNRELALCMYGREEDNNFFIDELRFPKHFLSEQSQVSYLREGCHSKKGYLGSIHNHPSGSCAMSFRDFLTFNSDSQALLEGIVCEAQRKNNRLRMGFTRKPSRD